MKLLCDLSREGNDCWIKEKWYTESDFDNLILCIYDDGFDMCISKFHGVNNDDVPEKVRQAFHEINR